MSSERLKRPSRLLGAITIVVALLLLSLLPSPVLAGTVTLSFTGTVNPPFPPLPFPNNSNFYATNGINPGDTITGTVAYDPAQLQLFSQAGNAAEYIGASPNAGVLTLQVDGLTLTSNDPVFGILTGTNGLLSLEFDLPTAPFMGGGGCFGSLPVALGLRASCTGVFFNGQVTSLNPPTTLPSGATGNLIFYNSDLPDGSSLGLSAEIQAGSPAGTPEPSTLALACTALLIGVGAVRRGAARDYLRS